ncbi:PAS domain S-box protein [Brevundimonas sp.]|uniref:PAS domain S-box protein n=1 Tax=Brevundimonas sp. TaxID=1871086 RepID=UPI002D288E18|nr:PAS domain S-box protein [Brevundimonas sp.]HYC68828.1 PAS domain S-box protein [Brevundimonas sp.]
MHSSTLNERPPLAAAGDPDFEDFFENGSIGLHIVDRDGLILRANKAELELLGYAPEEYVGRPIADFHADPQTIADILRRLGAGERLDKYPARLRTRNGGIKHVQISSSVLFRDGQFINTRCFTVDVSAAREADEARLAAERQLLATYDSVTVGIADADREGRLIRVNAAFEALTGYGRDELLGMTIAQLTHPDDRAQDAALYADQVAGRRDRYSLEKRYVRKGGEVVHVEVLSSTATDADGGFAHGVRVVKDVSERREAELRLQENERRSRELLDALPTAVYTTDPNGHITYFNEAAVKMAGRHPTVGVDRWCVTWKLFWPDGTRLEHEQCPMALALMTGEELRGLEAVAERPDGSRLTFTPYPTLLRDSSGAVVGAINVLVDITERKRADEAQKLLIDELNHRVKNTLATVQSIALQTQRWTPEAFTERFEDRLIALSKAHDLLTRRHWTGVGLIELLEEELAPYRDEVPGNARLEGPDLVLTARVGLALGMVIHELATNAAKYGALASPAGRLDLSWSIDVTGDERQLNLAWIERGGAPTESPARQGFGHRLIERTIRRDLGGVLEQRFEPSGLECRFGFTV